MHRTVRLITEMGPGEEFEATRLLDGYNKVDGRWIKFHPWPHLQDACIVIYSMMHFVPSFTLAPKTTRASG